jgi:hypothetical protein
MSRQELVAAGEGDDTPSVAGGPVVGRSWIEMLEAMAPADGVTDDDGDDSYTSVQESSSDDSASRSSLDWDRNEYDDDEWSQDGSDFTIIVQRQSNPYQEDHDDDDEEEEEEAAMSLGCPEDPCVSIRKVDTYQVDKANLTSGPFMSGYFRRLFRQPLFVENATNTVTIQLPEAAANVFEAVLYWFSGGDRCKGFGTSATGLVGAMFVADYLDMPGLASTVAGFIEDEDGLTHSSVCDFYRQAISLGQQERIFPLVENFLAGNIMEVSPDAEILSLLSVQSMLEIVTSEFLLQPKDHHRQVLTLHDGASRHLSKLVVAFVNQHQADVSAEEFAVLTRDEYLPVIDDSVFIRLLEMEEIIGRVGSLTPTSLKVRCYDVILALLKKRDYGDEQHKALEFLRSRPSAVAVDLLVQCLKPSQDQGSALPDFRDGALDEPLFSYAEYLWEP